ncbi:MULTISPECIES: flagellar basal body rod protein FlgC [Azospirillum]|uniref:Flagellar basal-body rod protein FlgC n=1 Tax=Azospirillum rugosum TaxID=416170 RepID=A0ABS4SYL4_9PROT|nr:MULTISPECIES: flagellar basal body rod protein FlgC [Azospirillum]MBP2297203.1 flagellar basal-body rod protein FlgC [Azospirillum rugosum]MCW2239861.1 flagellar basal-body rod protein FlgC [Azospirillum canadense]MDQ0531031.1 flagellar basal-body rod protein FlgC [Azospirillum rugosum]
MTILSQTDPLAATVRIASSGLQAQGTRLRVIAENIANADSTAATAGGDPYRRKTISFDTAMDRASGSEVVKVKQIGRDRSDFQLVFDPSHPAADDKGYVKRPNVQPLIEMMDMREASRSFEASVNVIEQSRSMMGRMIDLLRG